MHLADTDRADGVDRTRAQGKALHGEDDLRSRTESVAASRHKSAARVAALALNGDAETRRRCDARDHTERNAFAFENRPLLDVQLDPRRIVVLRQADLI